MGSQNPSQSYAGIMRRCVKFYQLYAEDPITSPKMETLSSGTRIYTPAKTHWIFWKKCWKSNAVATSNARTDQRDDWMYWMCDWSQEEFRQRLVLSRGWESLLSPQRFEQVSYGMKTKEICYGAKTVWVPGALMAKERHASCGLRPET